MVAYQYNELKFGYEVIETATGNSFGIYYSIEDAKTVAFNLIKTSAFDGWTPAFVLRSMKDHMKK